MEFAKLGFSLGALGVKKVASNEVAQEVLKFGLSFILPDNIIVSLKYIKLCLL